MLPSIKYHVLKVVTRYLLSLYFFKDYENISIDVMNYVDVSIPDSSPGFCSCAFGQFNLDSNFSTNSRCKTNTC